MSSAQMGEPAGSMTISAALLYRLYGQDINKAYDCTLSQRRFEDLESGSIKKMEIKIELFWLNSKHYVRQTPVTAIPTVRQHFTLQQDAYSQDKAGVVHDKFLTALQ